MVKAKEMRKALRKIQVISRGFYEKTKRSEAWQKENMKY